VNLELNIEKYLVKQFEDRRDRRFLPVELWIVSEGENRNRSSFTPESLVLAKDRFKNISLSAKYEQSRDDFRGHEVLYKGVDTEGWAEYEYIEVPVGVIPESSNPRIEFGEDGKQWLVVDALIWSERNRKVEKLLRKQKISNISMEVKVLDSETVDGIDVIKDFLPMSVVFISNQRRTGIAGAKGVIKEEEVRLFSNDLVLAFEAGEIGMGDPIKIDLKSSSISNDAWGSVDKTKLRNDIMDAENYELLITRCYLTAEDGWQDAPSEKLMYPVCQIKGGKLVYNRNAIITARRLLEGNKGEDYYNAVNTKLIKIEKKIGLWKEYDYAKFEGGVSLDREKLNTAFVSMFGANLIAFEDGIVTYSKINEDKVDFACKKYSIEPCVNEDGEESENLLVAEDEMPCELKFVVSEKQEVDGQEVTTEKFVCGGNIKEFILKSEQLAAEKNTILEEQARQNSEFEAKINTLNAQYESIVAENNSLESKNKEFEQKETFEKMKVIVKKYESTLGADGTKEWEAKARNYQAEDILEKDILFFMYSEKNNNEHFKFPAATPVAPAKPVTAWDILEGNIRSK
jgi:hypothetical protein